MRDDNDPRNAPSDPTLFRGRLRTPVLDDDPEGGPAEVEFELRMVTEEDRRRSPSGVIDTTGEMLDPAPAGDDKRGGSLAPVEARRVSHPLRGTALGLAVCAVSLGVTLFLLQGGPGPESRGAAEPGVGVGVAAAQPGGSEVSPPQLQRGTPGARDAVEADVSPEVIDLDAVEVEDEMPVAESTPTQRRLDTSQSRQSVSLRLGATNPSSSDLAPSTDERSSSDGSADSRSGARGRTGTVQVHGTEERLRSRDVPPRSAAPAASAASVRPGAFSDTHSLLEQQTPY